MFKEIDDAVSAYNMFVGKKKVVVGLSGGADSMCLLDYLSKNADRFGISVSAAHLNHCLRGGESERDNRFAEEQCRIRNVPLYVKRIDIARRAKEKKLGLEECGRIERYSFFQSLTDEETVIATAHTASDNAETILLNITRGCGMDGLTGIPPVRGNIVRPLINCSRSMIERYCMEQGVEFVTDSTNLTDEYSRNKIRLSVFPVLRQINPSVETAINRMSAVILQNLTFINSSVEDYYNYCVTDNGLDIQKLRECDRNILPSVIRYAADKLFGITAEKRHIDLVVGLINNGSGAVMLCGDNTVKVVGKELRFVKKSDLYGNKNLLPFEETAVQLGKTYRYNGKLYKFSTQKLKSDFNDFKINKNLVNQPMSCDIIACGAMMRNRRSGDVFKPIGRNCTKTVKKLFTELKIPVLQRDRLLVLAKGSNVYWIEEVGASQDSLPRNETDYCFTVEVEKVNNE